MSKQSLLLLTTFVATLLACKLLYFYDFVGIDDASIFFHYAENIVSGHGIVWNAGGERVEGFTSILWLIVCCLFVAIGLPLELCLLIVSALLVYITSRKLLQFYLEDIKLDLLAVYLLLVFLNLPYISWSLASLMDLSLWSCLLIFTLCSTIQLAKENTRKNQLYLGGLTCLLVLTRPEGVLIALFCYATLFIVNFKKAGLKSIFLPTGMFIDCCVFLVIFRLAYFNYPLPNTYYAKVGGDLLYNLSEGWSYFYSWLSSNYLHPFLILLLAFLALKTDFKHRLSIMFSFFYFFIYIYVGGDHFVFHRHYQAIWPLLVTLLLVSVQHLPVKKYAPLAALALLHLLSWPNKTDYQQMQYEHNLSVYGRHAGYTLNNYFPDEKPLVAAIAVGSLGYAYDGKVFDVMGLNDLEVAHTSGNRYGKKNHAAFNPEIFVKRAPELFVHFTVTCALKIDLKENPYISKMLSYLPTDPLIFQKMYAPFWLPGRSMIKPDYGYCGYIRRDFYEQVKDKVPFEIL